MHGIKYKELFGAVQKSLYFVNEQLLNEFHNGFSFMPSQW